VYRVWSEKLDLVRRAIDANVFQSEWFAWVDAGSFRGRYTCPEVNASFPLAAKFVPGKIQFGLVGDEPRDVTIDPASALPPAPLTGNLVAGGFFFGDAPAFRAFHKYYYAALRHYYDRGFFVGKDQ